ncbi:MAG: MarR family transcriptional regulator [Sedimentisphaerales bacterium]|nr:MarR family transcriptional regulator [Sedimentisphaerales bacterium]
MTLARELGLRKPFASREHEALLNIYFTSTCMKKQAVRFLEPYALTDVQLNLLMLLKYQSVSDQGLTQAQLSNMMLVNRANITSLVNRLERDGLVKRTTDPEDRRYNNILLTAKARRVLERVEPEYASKVRDVIAVLKPAEQKKLIQMLEKIRTCINTLA